MGKSAMTTPKTRKTAQRNGRKHPTAQERIDEVFLRKAYCDGLPFRVVDGSALLPPGVAATGEHPKDDFLWSDRVCAVAAAALDARQSLVVRVPAGWIVTATARIASSIGRRVCCGYDAPRGHLFFWRVPPEEDEEDDET